MTKAIYTATSEYISEVENYPVKHRVSVSGVLRILGVSRSGYNAWLKHVPSKTEERRNRIKEQIKDIYDESHQNYGAPKITQQLHKQGETTAEKTVGNYMRQMGIRAQWVKPYTVTTIDSDQSCKLKNILNEEFNPESPDAVWVSDITYIWTFEGFVYLTSIMDLFSRKIIAWVLSESLDAAHVVDCVKKAKQSRMVTAPLVFHTDRGCQYVSEAFKNATAGMINSYSKKAYPWDNACIESFHALLKREWINRFKIFNYRHAYRLVFEYIETFYNTVRKVGKNGSITCELIDHEN
ncbi:MAG: IS3 family transposase [Clostridiales bacterium]|nr:IS3 family transposase [Clostridiales bacterium]